MTEQRIQRLKRKLQESRYRLINREDGLYASFAAPLFSVIFVATKSVYHISTNGKCIYFDPDWLQKLGNVELDFILAHQLMHIEKGHIDRPHIYKGDKFHLGCDIIANANLIDMGYEFTRLQGIGRIYYETYFPHRYYGTDVTPEEAFKQIPFDPATLPELKRRQYMIDSEEWWDIKEDLGENGEIVLSPDDRDPEDLTLCDIIKDKVVFHSDYHFVNREFPKKVPNAKFQEKDGKTDLKKWSQEMAEQLQSLRNERKKADAGRYGLFDEKFWQLIRKPKLNWKEILSQFLQENVFDYSFVPPDRRFCESNFYLPSYNSNDYSPKDIIFMVDTSGSIDRECLIDVYSELCAATEQFNDKFRGMLGFFDTDVKNKLIAFESVDDLFSLIPIGGGGTDFSCVFDFVAEYENLDNVTSVIVFTDGKGSYPDMSPLIDVPVLWILSTDFTDVPFGTIAFYD